MCNVILFRDIYACFMAAFTLDMYGPKYKFGFKGIITCK